jgi:hypothetical protein
MGSSSITYCRDLSCIPITTELTTKRKQSGVDELSEFGARWLSYRG